MIKKILFPVLLLLSTTIAKADLGWHTAYEHNSSGTAVNGSVAALITAINAGADVKLLVLNGSGETTLVILPTFVFIDVAHSVVAAHYRAIGDEVLSNGNLQIQSNNYNIDVVVNSTSFVSYSRYTKSGSKMYDSTYSWAVRWLVNY